MTKYFYAVLAGSLLMVTGSLASQYSAVNRPILEAYYKAVEPISADAALDERSVIIRMGENPTAPAEYYVILDRAEKLKLRVEKTLYHDRYTDVSSTSKLQSVLESTGGANNVLNRAQQNFREKFGMNAMLEAGKPWQATHKLATTPHAPVSPYFLRWYLISLMLALTFCLMRAHEKGLPVWIELLQPSHLAVAVIAWPMFAWGYPRHSPKEQMVYALRFATATLGALLSFGAAGTAKAADGKDGSKRERKGKHSLQFDFRYANSIGAASAPEGFGRLTATHESGYFFETVNVMKPGFKLTSDTIGRPVVSGKLGVVDAVGGVVLTNVGANSLQAGVQIYGGTKHWGIAVPSLGVERQYTPSWVTTYVAGGQFFAKPTARLKIGVEGSVRKSLGTKPSWYLGALMGWSFGKGRPSVEGFVLHNSAGAQRGRLRLVQTFAF